MNIEEFHNQRMKEVAEKLRGEGYDVAIEPGPSLLPAFLKSLRPDLIAKRGDETVVVEVKSRQSLRSSDQVRKLADALKDRPGWRFDLVLLEDSEVSANAHNSELLPAASIGRRLDEAERSLAHGDRDAALLFAWIAVEAALREMAEANQLQLSTLSPQTVIRELVAAGIVDRETYRELNELLQFRNRVVHGFTISGLGDDRVRQLIATGRRLLSEMGPQLAIREDTPQ